MRNEQKCNSDIRIILFQVETVSIGKEEPLWIVNFKRALAAQIQLQLDGASGVFQQGEYDNYYAENTVYHAMEVNRFFFNIYW